MKISLMTAKGVAKKDGIYSLKDQGITACSGATYSDDQTAKSANLPVTATRWPSRIGSATMPRFITLRDFDMKKMMLVLLVAGSCFGCKPGDTEFDMKPLTMVQEAADKGNANAQLVLGNMYDQGQGVEQNATTAAEWISKAAEQGNFVAQLQLAKMYVEGRGVEQDYKEAFGWFLSAVQLGKAKAEEAEQTE